MNRTVPRGEGKTTSDAIYGRVQSVYLKRGTSPIPVAGKVPPAGLTAYHGAQPVHNYRRWSRMYARANVAIALFDEQIGIDVDAYRGGGEVLRALEKQLGRLPRTIMSTARDDGSGIRLFTLPEGYDQGGIGWAGKPEPGIDIIWSTNRYVVAPPSIHPDLGLPYRWLDSRTMAPVAFLPADEWPMLPYEWVRYLYKGDRQHETRGAVGYEAEWLVRHGRGKPCLYVEQMAARATHEILTAADSGGVHDSACDWSWTLVRAIGEGHVGVNSGLRAVRDAFYEAVEARNRRRVRAAPGEWARMLNIAVQKNAERGVPGRDSVCSELEDFYS